MRPGEPWTAELCSPCSQCAAGGKGWNRERSAGVHWPSKINSQCWDVFLGKVCRALSAEGSWVFAGSECWQCRRAPLSLRGASRGSWWASGAECTSLCSRGGSYREKLWAALLVGADMGKSWSTCTVQGGMGQALWALAAGCWELLAWVGSAWAVAGTELDDRLQEQKSLLKLFNMLRFCLIFLPLEAYKQKTEADVRAEGPSSCYTWEVWAERGLLWVPGPDVAIIITLWWHGLLGPDQVIKFPTWNEMSFLKWEFKWISCIYQQVLKGLF